MVTEIHRLQANRLDMQFDRSNDVLPKNINVGNVSALFPGLGNLNMDQITDLEKKQLELAIGQLNNTVKSTGTEIRLKYHDEAEQMIVELIDQASKEVVATSPPEYLLELSVRMKEMIGLFLDQKA